MKRIAISVGVGCAGTSAIAAFTYLCAVAPFWGKFVFFCALFSAVAYINLPRRWA